MSILEENNIRKKYVNKYIIEFKIRDNKEYK